MGRCILCGETLDSNNLCPNIQQHFKPMCLNCQFCDYKQNLLCLNEDNKKDAIEKLKSINDIGYEIKDITLSPLPLKDPTKKCKRYKFNEMLVIKLNNSALYAHDEQEVVPNNL